jgi:hypothetical protein
MGSRFFRFYFPQDTKSVEVPANIVSPDILFRQPRQVLIGSEHIAFGSQSAMTLPKVILETYIFWRSVRKKSRMPKSRLNTPKFTGSHMK